MTTPTDEMTIKTAEEFAREQDDRAATRDLQLRRAEADARHGRVLALIWAPAVTLIILGLFAVIGFVVHQVSTEHGKQVHVWCFADPNVDTATSEFTGSPSNVKGLCPDAR
jgi:hypothetical protein